MFSAILLTMLRCLGYRGPCGSSLHGYVFRQKTHDRLSLQVQLKQTPVCKSSIKLMQDGKKATLTHLLDCAWDQLTDKQQHNYAKPVCVRSSFILRGGGNKINHVVAELS